MRNTVLFAIILSFFIVSTHLTAFAKADKTNHPVYMVHGVLGWTKAMGFGTHYFGDDLGTFAGDACDSFFEMKCNRKINKKQVVHEVKLTSLQNTYVRGFELYKEINKTHILEKICEFVNKPVQEVDDMNLVEIKNLIASIPVANRPFINIIAHSQGTIDSRYAAKLLADRYGYPVVKVLVSVSGCHRGSGIANTMYKLKESNILLYSTMMWFFEKMWCGIISGEFKSGKESIGEEMLKSMAYYDIDDSDGRDTGIKHFNDNVPLSDKHVAKYVSFMTARKKSQLSIPMQALIFLSGDIDGNVYEMDSDKLDTCDRENTSSLNDDDGFIPIYSQHIGTRMRYKRNYFKDDKVSEISWTGIVTNADIVDRVQMGDPELNGMDGVIDIGHFQEITLPFGILTNGFRGLHFDELGYYSAMIDYIAKNDN
ncbi:MAG: hypothetical protein GY760_00855 [Deltaproteobacteria bacterium]|nr:hypothetical protein [Deltaproteobacteria bacterium]